MGINLSRARYQAALQRMRDRIASGIPLVAYDDTTRGSKETHCSWGLCSTDREAWPDAEDHLWPDLFLKHGRVAPKYRKHQCPIDGREDPGMLGWGYGCFYGCRVFQAKGNTPRRETVLRWYDEQIGGD